MWVSHTFPSNHFELFFPQPQVFSSHVCIHQYSVNYKRSPYSSPDSLLCAALSTPVLRSANSSYLSLPIILAWFAQLRTSIKVWLHSSSFNLTWKFCQCSKIGNIMAHLFYCPSLNDHCTLISNSHCLENCCFVYI